MLALASEPWSGDSDSRASTGVNVHTSPQTATAIGRGMSRSHLAVLRPLVGALLQRFERCAQLHQGACAPLHRGATGCKSRRRDAFENPHYINRGKPKKTPPRRAALFL